MLLFFGASASCSDATAPMGALIVVVSPDTVRVAQTAVPSSSTYRVRLVSIGQTKLWLARAELETEVTPGKWSTWSAPSDPNNLYLQAALGDAFAAVASDDLSAPRSFYVPMVAGRYRIRQQFQLTAPSATEPTGDVSVATSNTFVVVTP